MIDTNDIAIHDLLDFNPPRLDSDPDAATTATDDDEIVGDVFVLRRW
jgi:hypothetical protein